MVGSADRNAVEHEGTGGISPLRMSLRILGARPGVELLKFALGDSKLSKGGADR